MIGLVCTLSVVVAVLLYLRYVSTPFEQGQAWVNGPWRFRLRYRLSTLIIIMTLAALVLGLFVLAV